MLASVGTCNQYLLHQIKLAIELKASQSSQFINDAYIIFCLFLNSLSQIIKLSKSEYQSILMEFFFIEMLDGVVSESDQDIESKQLVQDQEAKSGVLRPSQPRKPLEEVEEMQFGDELGEGHKLVVQGNAPVEKRQLMTQDASLLRDGEGSGSRDIGARRDGRLPDSRQTPQQVVHLQGEHAALPNDHNEEQEEDLAGSLDAKDMLMIVDRESNVQFDINDYWQNQVFVADSTNYYDKQSSRTFTTLSRRDNFVLKDIWDEFWFRKDHANSELIYAASQGHVSKTRDLLSPFNQPEDQAEILFSDAQGLNALHVAVINDQQQIIRILLDTDKSILSARTFNDDKRTALHLAVLEQLPIMVQILIREYCANVDCADSRGNTPLHYAAQIGSESITSTILQAKPRLHEAVNRDGRTPLDLAQNSNIANKLSHYANQAYQQAVGGRVSLPRLHAGRLATSSKETRSASRGRSAALDFSDSPKKTANQRDAKLRKSSLAGENDQESSSRPYQEGPFSKGQVAGRLLSDQWQSPEQPRGTDAPNFQARNRSTTPTSQKQRGNRPSEVAHAVSSSQSTEGLGKNLQEQKKTASEDFEAYRKLPQATATIREAAGSPADAKGEAERKRNSNIRSRPSPETASQGSRSQMQAPVDKTGTMGLASTDQADALSTGAENVEPITSQDNKLDRGGDGMQFDNYDEDDSVQGENVDEDREEDEHDDKETATALEEELADIKLRQRMEQIKKLNISMDDDLDVESNEDADPRYEEEKEHEEFLLNEDGLLDRRANQGADGGMIQTSAEDGKLDPAQNQRAGLQESRNIINNYELINYIGEGAFGQVYLCRHVRTGKKYAMKVQDKQRIDEMNFLKFAKSEQKILAKVSKHPFIVQMKQSFQNEKKLFLILEYCPCGNLSRVLKKQRCHRLSEDQARIYVCEIILAIEYLHNLNIIYRDMKPENVLVCQDGHIKLTDFGLSKEIKDDYYNSNSFCGSHAYLAPEMLENKPHGKSIDWYGVGTILYEFLVSVPPYFSSDQDKLYENIKKAPLIMAKNMFSPECESLLKQLLKRNPLERLGASSGAQEIRAHEWFRDVDWDDVLQKRTFAHQYSEKVLKAKQNKIDMESLMVKTHELSSIKYKDKELKHVKNWSVQL